MARRTKKESLATRESIMDAAEQCFSSFGVSGTDMASVALHANCSRGAIYWHFKDRQDLFCAIMERAQPFLSSRLLELISTVDQRVLVSLRKCLHRYFLDIESNDHLRCVLNILIYRCDFSDELAAYLKSWLEEQETVHMLMQKIFDRALLRGELNEEVCARQSSQLLCSTVMGILAFFLMRKKGELQFEGATILNVLLENIRSERSKSMIDSQAIRG